MASAGRTALSEAVSPLEGGHRGLRRTGLPRRAVFKQLKRGLGIPCDKQEIQWPSLCPLRLEVRLDDTTAPLCPSPCPAGTLAAESWVGVGAGAEQGSGLECCWGQRGRLYNSGSHVDAARKGEGFQKGHVSTVTRWPSLFPETCALCQDQCPRM